MTAMSAADKAARRKAVLDDLAAAGRTGVLAREAAQRLGLRDHYTSCLLIRLAESGDAVWRLAGTPGKGHRARRYWAVQFAAHLPPECPPKPARMGVDIRSIRLDPNAPVDGYAPGYKFTRCPGAVDQRYRPACVDWIREGV